MTTIIAEKPSAGRDIARLVGATGRAEGYMYGNGYYVTWAFGHLVEITAENDDDWNQPLPVLPESFHLRVGMTKNEKTGKRTEDDGYRRQLSVIKHLFDKSDLVINAGDAGREGELIQRYIYQYIGSSKPVRRLWISSLTDEAILQGLKNLKDSAVFDNLYLAGKARNEADWLVGINCTRALTKKADNGKVLSLGRVQTAILGLLCSRYIENRDFVPEKYWNLNVRASLAGSPFVTRADRRYSTYAEAFADMEKVQQEGSLTVTSAEKKNTTLQSPLPFDLTALQREANSRYSMSAKETLDTAQALYEKKLITYPRTGSRYITEDVFSTLPAIAAKVLPAEMLAVLGSGPLNRHCINAAKVTDHHALLPTGNTPAGLTDREEKIYSLIVTRLAETLSPPCQAINTTVKLASAGVTFTCKGQTIIEKGWKAIRNEPEKTEDEDEPGQTLPPFHTGDICNILNIGIKDGLTKPRPLYTEATLLEAMEHAGKHLSEENLKDAIKECGIGTPATRASEINILLLRGYIGRDKKQLVPTPLGLSVYEEVKDKSICNVELTAEWEMKLAGIAEGSYDPEAFDREIRVFVRKITAELLSSDTISSAVRNAETLPGASCPKCGSPVILRTRTAQCSHPSCDWKIWKEVAGKTLQQKDLAALITKGETMELKGFKSKSGKPFNAVLVLERETGRLSFRFVDHNSDKEGNRLVCPLCGKNVWVNPQIVSCSDKEQCGWKMWRTVCGKTLTEPLVISLLTRKKTPLIKGFKGKTGKTFDAALCLDQNGEVKFEFPSGGRKLKKK